MTQSELEKVVFDCNYFETKIYAGNFKAKELYDYIIKRETEAYKRGAREYLDKAKTELNQVLHTSTINKVMDKYISENQPTTPEKGEQG